MSVNQAYNYKKVGDNVCTAGLLNEEQLSCLCGEEYEVVINLLPDDSKYAIKNEREIVAGQGIAYHYIPVDFAAPGLEDYHKFEVIMNQIGERKVLIHCAANHRVSAFYSVYARRNLGWSEQQAYDLITSIWNPAKNSQWQQFITRTGKSGQHLLYKVKQGKFSHRHNNEILS